MISALLALSGCMTSDEVRGLADALNNTGNVLHSYASQPTYGFAASPSACWLIGEKMASCQ